MADPRVDFTARFILDRLPLLPQGDDIVRICDDADYAWDRIINPRPLAKGEGQPSKKEMT